MSRVLVTGATGFIGRAVLGPLLAAGHDVHAVSRRGAPEWAPPEVRWDAVDLLADPAAAVEAARPETLLHLAWYAEHGRYWTSPENLRWVAATLELVRSFAAAGGRRAVGAGTCAEYEWAGGRCVEGVTPLRPATLYGTAKDATRALLEAAAGELGIEVAWGRVFFLYGPHEDDRRLVASVARALAEGRRAATGDGRQVRDLLHVGDVAGAFAALAGSAVTGAVNIGSGEGRALRDVIAQVGAAAGRPELLDVGALPPRPGDPDELVADIARLRDEVGFAPRIGLEEGIARTVEWWRQRAASPPI